MVVSLSVLLDGVRRVVVEDFLKKRVQATLNFEGWYDYPQFANKQVCIYYFVIHH